MTTTTKPTFSVNLWDAHPESGEDACNTGVDFPSEAEARAAFEAEDLLGALAAHGLNRVYYSTWRFAELCRGTRDAEGTRFAETFDVRENPKAPRRRADRDDDWRREQAMQAGMALGCDGYNDAMGY